MKKQPTRYNNIFMYTTKSGQKKYRVIITVNNIPVDKSGFDTIGDARHFIMNIDNYITEKKKKKYQDLTDILFEDYYYIYEKKMVTIGRWSYDTQRHVEFLMKAIFQYFKDKRLSQITKLDCQNMLDDLASKNYRTNTIKVYRRTVIAILNQAIKDEIIVSNKMSLTYIPNSSVPKHNKELSKNDYEKLKSYINENCNVQMRTFFALCRLGLRKGEAIAVSESKLTFLDDGSVKILINDTVTKYSKNGTGRTKTGASRFIFGNSELSTLLHECIASNKKIFKLNKKLYSKTHPLVITNSANTIHTHSINVKFKKICNEIGIQVTPHMLRHYFATQGQLTGLNPRLIADFLGHKNISMTEHYSHQTDEGTKLVLDKIQDLL